MSAPPAFFTFALYTVQYSHWYIQRIALDIWDVEYAIQQLAQGPPMHIVTYCCTQVILHNLRLWLRAEILYWLCWNRWAGSWLLWNRYQVRQGGNLIRDNVSIPS
jgi:hypothetical protein